MLYGVMVLEEKNFLINKLNITIAVILIMLISVLFFLNLSNIYEDYSKYRLETAKNQNNVEQQEKIILQNLHFQKRYGKNFYYVNAINKTIAFYLSQNMYQEADNIYSIYLPDLVHYSYSPFFGKYLALSSIYLKMARIKIKLNDYKTAEIYLNKALYFGEMAQKKCTNNMENPDLSNIKIDLKDIHSEISRVEAILK